jgi:hypothetical protein
MQRGRSGPSNTSVRRELHPAAGSADQRDDVRFSLKQDFAVGPAWTASIFRPQALKTPRVRVHFFALVARGASFIRTQFDEMRVLFTFWVLSRPDHIH